MEPDGIYWQELDSSKVKWKEEQSLEDGDLGWLEDHGPGMHWKDYVTSKFIRFMNRSGIYKTFSFLDGHISSVISHNILISFQSYLKVVSFFDFL